MVAVEVDSKAMEVRLSIWEVLAFRVWFEYSTAVSSKDVAQGVCTRDTNHGGRGSATLAKI